MPCDLHKHHFATLADTSHRRACDPTGFPTLPHDRLAPAPVQGPEVSLVTRHKRSFGEVSRLPSGRYRARYRELNGHRVSAPTTFPSKGEADRWLTLRRAELLKSDWTSTVTGTGSFGDYAETWLTQRQLKPRTRAHYRSLLDKQILPTFARTPLRSISPTMVRRWHSSLSPDTPTLRAHAYGLLRAILHTAVYDGEITANPAHIRGAGTTTRAVAITPATLDQLTTLVAAMPPRRQAMILLAAWCGLRFGEITELRRETSTFTAVSFTSTGRSLASTGNSSSPPPRAPLAVATWLSLRTSCPSQQPSRRAHRSWARRTALSRRRRPQQASRTRQPVQDLLSRSRDRRAARSALARPTPHRRRPRRPHRRHARRTDEPSRPLHPAGRPAVPTRDQRSRCSNRDCPQPTRRRRGAYRQRSIVATLNMHSPSAASRTIGRVVYRYLTLRATTMSARYWRPVGALRASVRSPTGPVRCGRRLASGRAGLARHPPQAATRRRRGVRTSGGRDPRGEADHDGEHGTAGLDAHPH